MREGMEQTTTQTCWFISVKVLNMGLWTFALRAAPVSVVVAVWIAGLTLCPPGDGATAVRT